MSPQVGESKALDAARRAVTLGEGLAESHNALGSVMLGLLDWSQAEGGRTRCSLPNNAEVVRTLYYARDYDRAIEQGKKALQLAPDYYRTHFWLARVYAQKGMYREAMPNSNVGLTELAYSLAAGGHQLEARMILQRLEEKSKRDFVPAYNLAVIHVALNEPDKALHYLEKAYQERDWAMMVLAVEPRLEPLRGNPSFQELLAKSRLPL